jgi:hypothetical protein
MRNKQMLKTAQKQTSSMSGITARLLFWATFKKVPKTQFGRCVTCKANEICYKINVCKCSDDQQYDLRMNDYKLK